MKLSLLIAMAIAFCNINSKETYTLVPLFETPQIIEIKATLNKSACNNKAYIPIDLPKNADGWIYSITAIKKSEMESPKTVLPEQLEKYISKYDADQLADFIPYNASNRSFNLYLLPGKENVSSFNNCGHYKYTEKYIDTKSRSGFIKNTGDETMYIGIENNRDLKTLRLKIEAVAIVKN